MADEQTQNVDPSNTKDVAKKLGQSLLEGFKNISSGMGKNMPGKDMVREMGRSMFTGGIAAAGSNAAINSGDPTYALNGQRMAQAVDRTIQQHWWIQKAKDFEKEKLKPMQKQMTQLKQDFDLKSTELQSRIYAVNSEFSPEKEEALRAQMEELQAQGQLTPELEKSINQQISEIKAGRENALSTVMVDYSSMMSAFNTAYGDYTMNLMNEASMFDPSNPILGDMINRTVGVISQEAESFTSRLSQGQEAGDAAAAADATHVGMASRPVIAQRQRMNEAGVVQSEAEAQVSQTAAQESQDDLDRTKPPAEEITGLDRLASIIQENLRTSKSPGRAIRGAINDQRVMQETQTIWADDVDQMSRALGYKIEDEDGNPGINEDLTDENEMVRFTQDFAQFALALKGAQSIPGNEKMNVSQLSDYLDDVNTKEQLGIPTAVSIVQERMAKVGKRIKPKDVIKALDKAQEANPVDAEEMIAGAIEVLGGNVQPEKEKGTWESVKEVAQGLFSRNEEKQTTDNTSSVQNTDPRHPPGSQSKDKRNIVQRATDAVSAANRPRAGLLTQPNDPRGVKSNAARQGILAGSSTDSRNPSSSRNAPTPKTLLGDVAPNDHGKVYGALTARRGNIQERIAAGREDADTVSEVNALEREIKSLDAFINVYRDYAKDKKDVREQMSTFLKEGKNPDKVLQKYGL